MRRLCTSDNLYSTAMTLAVCVLLAVVSFSSVRRLDQPPTCDKTVCDCGCKDGAGCKCARSQP